MSGRITLTLRDDLLRQAEQIARASGRPVAELLTEAIDSTLNPFGGPVAAPPSLDDLKDREVLAAADAMMSRAEGRRLSDLLARQREGELTPSERTELMALMRVYQTGMLRKAAGIAEAVRRGLRPPPAP